MSIRGVYFFAPDVRNDSNDQVHNIQEDLRAQILLHLIGRATAGLHDHAPQHVGEPHLFHLLQDMHGTQASSHIPTAESVKANPFTAPSLPTISSADWKNKKDAPKEFICSILQDTMENPVYTRCKHAFERSALTQWISSGKQECPLCRKPTDLTSFKDWPELKNLISLWKKGKPQPVAKKDSKATKEAPKPTKKSQSAPPPRHLRDRSIEALPRSSRISLTSQPVVDRSGSLSSAEKAQRHSRFFSSTPQQDAHKLLELAKYISKEPIAGQLSQLDKKNKTSSDPFLTRPSFKQIFSNVYVLHRNQTGKKPSDPHFGSNAFYQRNKINISQEIRNQAVYLAALKQIGLAFEGSTEVPTTLQLFDQLPRKIRNEIYGFAYEFAQVQGIALQGSRAGELAFRNMNPDHNIQRAIVIESYLQAKLTLSAK